MKRADYGIDAPPVVRNLMIAGFAGIVAGSALYGALKGTYSVLSLILLNWGVWAGGFCLLAAGLMIWSSKFGKLRERERLLDALQLRGHEHVLDVGCGRGLLLIGAAQRLHRGKAVGIDVWQSADQSGNNPDATWANARAEGVHERVELKTGDMQKMPFADGEFDAVVASLSIHNIYNPQGRAQAVREIARVLKPGGRVALLDFQCTAEYAQTLRELGWQDAQCSGLHFAMYPPVRIVTGTKPRMS